MMKSRKILSIITAAAVALSFSVIQTGPAAAASSQYWIKVNKRANVCTVYKKQSSGSYKPIRAMLVSCGRKGRTTTTPSGTFSLKKKWKWELLYGGSYGRYAMQFYRDFLFHTCGYHKKGSPGTINVGFYKKLGKNVSAGCVRMQFIDEKWLYRTCPRGTRVTVYSSRRAGPLGRPKAAPLKTSRKYYYDPTDPSKKNKAYSLRAPRITVGKPDEISYGTPFDPLEGVTARDTRSFQDLTARIKYSLMAEKNDGSWAAAGSVNTNFDESLYTGKYRITYTCYYYYCSKKTGIRTFELTVDPQDKEGN